MVLMTLLDRFKVSSNTFSAMKQSTAYATGNFSSLSDIKSHLSTLRLVFDQ